MKKVLTISCTLAVIAAVALLRAANSPNMKISSSAFKNNGDMPAKYTCDGSDAIPPLKIDDVPEEAGSLALIMEDPDAPSGTFDHWLVFDMDPAVREIGEGAHPAGVKGRNSSGETGYKGPCPPKGVHHYIFTLYALDSKLALSEGATKKDIMTAMDKKILDRAKLVGLYGRKK